VAVAGILQELHRDGLTVVLVTHDEDLAEQVSERVVRLRYGCLVSDDRGQKP
jgi:putative ABC transport system ATP-binding protein